MAIDEVGAAAAKRCLENVGWAETDHGVNLKVKVADLDEIVDISTADGGLWGPKSRSVFQKVKDLLARPQDAVSDFYPETGTLAVVLVGQLTNESAILDVQKAVRSAIERRVLTRQLHWLCLLQVDDNQVGDPEWSSLRATLGNLISDDDGTDHCFIVSDWNEAGWVHEERQLGEKLGDILTQFTLGDLWDYDGFLTHRFADAEGVKKPGVSALGWYKARVGAVQRQILQFALAQRVCEVWCDLDDEGKHDSLVGELKKSAFDIEFLPRGLSHLSDRQAADDRAATTLQQEVERENGKLDTSRSFYERWNEEQTGVANKQADGYLANVGATLVTFLRDNRGFGSIGLAIGDLISQLTEGKDNLIAEMTPALDDEESIGESYRDAKKGIKAAFRRVQIALLKRADPRSAAFWGVAVVLPLLAVLAGVSKLGVQIWPINTILLLLGAAGLAFMVAAVGVRDARRLREAARQPAIQFLNGLRERYKAKTRDLFLEEVIAQLKDFSNNVEKISKLPVNMKKNFETRESEMLAEFGGRERWRSATNSHSTADTVRAEPFPSDRSLFESLLDEVNLAEYLRWNGANKALEVRDSELEERITGFCRTFTTQTLGYQDPWSIGPDPECRLRQWVELASPQVPYHVAQESSKRLEAIVLGIPEVLESISDQGGEYKLVRSLGQDQLVVMTALDLTAAVLASRSRVGSAR